MDDTPNLIEKLLELTSMKIIDVSQGADLQSVRVKCDDYELLLNFEEYSHSCWLECITETDCDGLKIIETRLENPKTTQLINQRK